MKVGISKLFIAKMENRINKPNKTQEGRILEALRYAKIHNDGWVNGQYFLRTMLISQYHRAIHNLENRDHVAIEHSAFKDEFGFLSYRLINEPGQNIITPKIDTTSHNSLEWRFKSETNPNKIYTVIDFTAYYVCDCPGYDKGHKICWHIETVKQILKLNIQYPGYPISKQEALELVTNIHNKINQKELFK